MAQAKTKKVTVTAGGEKHVVYKKTTKKGEGKVGHIMVNHPTKDKGQWDTIDLTAKAKAKTVKQGVAATKKWHKENPYPKQKMKLGGSAKSCWPGYEKKGTKKMYGKTYNNCVKKQLWQVVEHNKQQQLSQ